MSERDIEVMARTIFGECRGETDFGKLAVAWVIKNRAKKYNVSLGTACLLSVHFSAWNNGASNDANQIAMLMADLGSNSYGRCMIAAIQAAYEIEPDPTQGATHYFNPDIVNPAWAKGKPYVSIGRHRFVRDVD